MGKIPAFELLHLFRSLWCACLRHAAMKCGNIRTQPIDRRGCGRPRGHEADHLTAIGAHFPALEVVALHELRSVLRADGDELLVGRRVAGEVRAGRKQAGAQALRHGIGMRGQFEEQTVFEQLRKLRTNHHALGQ